MGRREGYRGRNEVSYTKFNLFAEFTGIHFVVSWPKLHKSQWRPPQGGHHPPPLPLRPQNQQVKTGLSIYKLSNLQIGQIYKLMAHIDALYSACRFTLFVNIVVYSYSSCVSPLPLPLSLLRLSLLHIIFYLFFAIDFLNFMRQQGEKEKKKKED